MNIYIIEKVYNWDNSSFPILAFISQDEAEEWVRKNEVQRCIFGEYYRVTVLTLGVKDYAEPV